MNLRVNKRWWLIALVAMVVINAALWLWLGPRGGFGLFLFLPFLFLKRGRDGRGDSEGPV
ncbi:MAG: hypothetical protein MAG453_00859 [Calditrichaeota bacterium]|nr:hypothetical protein [Calditrichota bacterium]